MQRNPGKKGCQPKRAAAPQYTRQQRRLLELLAAAFPQPVPLPEILDPKVSQYCARIHELREVRCEIENITAWQGGVRPSWYRLTRLPGSFSRPSPSSPERQASLLGGDL
jgi:hypothetical protein